MDEQTALDLIQRTADIAFGGRDRLLSRLNEQNGFKEWDVILGVVYPDSHGYLNASYKHILHHFVDPVLRILRGYTTLETIANNVAITRETIEKSEVPKVKELKTVLDAYESGFRRIDKEFNQYKITAYNLKHLRKLEGSIRDLSRSFFGKVGSPLDKLLEYTLDFAVPILSIAHKFGYPDHPRSVDEVIEGYQWIADLNTVPADILLYIPGVCSFEFIRDQKDPTIAFRVHAKLPTRYFNALRSMMPTDSDVAGLYPLYHPRKGNQSMRILEEKVSGVYPAQSKNG